MTWGTSGSLSRRCRVGTSDIRMFVYRTFGRIVGRIIRTCGNGLRALVRVRLRRGVHRLKMSSGAASVSAVVSRARVVLLPYAASPVMMRGRGGDASAVVVVKDDRQQDDADDGSGVASASRYRWMAHANGVRELNETRIQTRRKALASSTSGRMEAMGKRVDEAAPALRRLAEKALAYGEKAWRGMAEAKPGSVKKRIHEAGMYAMDRIDPRETTLCGVPRAVTSMEVVYPSGVVGAATARRLVEETLREGTKNARAATWMFSVGVPLSMPMFLTPLSNFPLYYFMFRLWSSTAATANGARALELLSGTDEARAMEIEAEVLEATGKGTPGGFDECKRLRPINCLNSETGTEAATTDEPLAVACCRLAKLGAGADKFVGAHGPEVLFVPCDALAKMIKDHIDSEEPSACSAAKQLERVFGASGAEALARKHKRYDEIYGVDKKTS